MHTLLPVQWTGSAVLPSPTACHDHPGAVGPVGICCTASAIFCHQARSHEQQTGQLQRGVCDLTLQIRDVGTAKKWNGLCLCSLLSRLSSRCCATRADHPARPLLPAFNAGRLSVSPWRRQEIHFQGFCVEVEQTHRGYAPHSSNCVTTVLVWQKTSCNA